MKFVEHWGELYRMSERAFHRYLAAGALGKTPDPATYGKVIGLVSFCSVDATPRDYQAKLHELKESKKETK